MTFSLSEAFKRRERALVALSQLHAAIVSIYQGMRDWDWPASGALSGGRALLPPGFLEAARGELAALAAAQAAYLQVPIGSRVRNLLTAPGQAQAAAAAADEAAADAAIGRLFDAVSARVEVMKAAGLPGNEASRLRQYTGTALAEWEKARAAATSAAALAVRAAGTVPARLQRSRADRRRPSRRS